jgi:nucleoside-diphosphate-sugar epimerase
VSAAGRVFVTGATGFIGRALCDRYRARGWEVRGMDLVADPDRGVVAGDVKQPDGWRDHVAGCDVVIHAAAKVSMRQGYTPFWETNVLGTRRVLDVAAQAGVGRFVQVSSVTAFSFEFPDGVDERYPTRTNGVPYADTKVAGEQVVLQAHAAGEIECTVVRPADVYGPGAMPWTIVPVQEIRRGRFLLPAMGRGVFSPNYIENVVDGIALAAEVPQASGQVFTLTDGISLPARAFFDHYARMLGKRGVRVVPTVVTRGLVAAVNLGAALQRVETEISPAAAAYLTRTAGYSIEKARSLLGYEPRIGLEEGMRLTEAWLRAQGMLD